MQIFEIKQNLFSLENTHYLAHCISADFNMGAGIAVEFNKRYGLQDALKENSPIAWPTTILIKKTFNLITKERYWHKPTYQTLEASLRHMALICKLQKVKKVAMPKIGCGLDRLQWEKVKRIIEREFKDLDIEVVICYL